MLVCVGVCVYVSLKHRVLTGTSCDVECSYARACSVCVSLRRGAGQAPRECMLCVFT